MDIKIFKTFRNLWNIIYNAISEVFCVYFLGKFIFVTDLKDVVCTYNCSTFEIEGEASELLVNSRKKKQFRIMAKQNSLEQFLVEWGFSKAF
jgi:hypothetical protein